MNQGKKLAESGVLLALTILMLLMFLYIPVLGIILFFFMPAPFALVASKYDLKWSTIFLIAALLITFILGNVALLPITLTVGLVGMTIGYYIRTNRSKLEMFIISTLLFIASMLLSFLAAMYLMDINVVDSFFKMLESSTEQAGQSLKALGQEEKLDQLLDQLVQFKSLFQTLLPSLLVLSSMIMTALMVLASKAVINRSRFAKLEIGSVRDIKLPRSLLWYYLLSMLFILFMHPEQGDYFYTVLMNIQFILEFFIMLQGISFMFFYSRSKGWSKGIPIVVVVLAFFIPIASSFVRILGIMDLGFRIRESIASK
ncbi:YybS family protein [Bacillus sp. 1P06AnD]|uniref:YybS family protein n=1 Tax=Bacillus sp. 1P06AnD TaxID=3132208 RepID=UPI0039A11367